MFILHKSNDVVWVDYSQWLLAFGFMLLLLTACTQQREEDVLMVPVVSFSAADDWAVEHFTDRLSFVNTLADSYADAQNTVIVVNATRWPKATRQVTLILDGIDDDSIRSYRYDVLAVEDGEQWRVVESRKSWRCVQGRGHSEFSAEPCV